MTNFNGINSNIGINNFGFNTKKKAEKKEEETQAQPQRTDVNFKSADEVLSFMAAANKPVIADKEPTTEAAATKNVIQISKYVTPEQAKRIAGYVADYETKMTTFTGAAKAEGLSPDAAQQLALMTFESNYL